MLPYILAAVGGYLIGDSLNAKLFEDGGIAKGGEFMLNDDLYKLVSDMDEDEYEAFANEYGIDSDDANEMTNFIYDAKMIDVKKMIKEIEEGKYSSGEMAKGGKVKVREEGDSYIINLLQLLKFHKEKPTILLIMIADEVSEDFMHKKFNSTIEWDKLSNEEKEKYNSDYRKNKKEFEKYLMYEFVRLYYSDKKVKEKCKGSSKSTISAIKSVMTDLAKKYPENKYADGGMMADGGKTKGGFAVGQSIIIEPTKNPKLDRAVRNLINSYSGKELVIEKIKVEKPYNTAKVFVRETGEKPSFDVILNPRYVKQYAKGGKVKKKWIQEALTGDEGSLRRTAKRKGLLRGDENLSMTDLKKLQKMGGKTAKRAHLAETLSKFENGGRIWSEIRADFEDDGYIFVDGWLTENDDEEGKTIAKINIKSDEVMYVDERAKNDSYAQEVISEAKKQKR